MLPRATDRGSVRAGWELLGCKMKARPPSTGISEETLNERGRREVTGVHSFRYFVSCQPSQLILLLPSSSLLPTPPQVPKPSFKSQGVGGILTVSPPGGGSSPLRVVALPVAKVQADSRAPPPRSWPPRDVRAFPPGPGYHTIIPSSYPPERCSSNAEHRHQTSGSSVACLANS